MLRNLGSCCRSGEIKIDSALNEGTTSRVEIPRIVSVEDWEQ